MFFLLRLFCSRWKSIWWNLKPRSYERKTFPSSRNSKHAEHFVVWLVQGIRLYCVSVFLCVCVCTCVCVCVCFADAVINISSIFVINYSFMNVISLCTVGSSECLSLTERVHEFNEWDIIWLLDRPTWWCAGNQRWRSCCCFWRGLGVTDCSLC